MLQVWKDLGVKWPHQLEPADKESLGRPISPIIRSEMSQF